MTNLWHSMKRWLFPTNHKDISTFSVLFASFSFSPLWQRWLRSTAGQYFLQWWPTVKEVLSAFNLELIDDYIIKACSQPNWEELKFISLGLFLMLLFSRCRYLYAVYKNRQIVKKLKIIVC